MPNYQKASVIGLIVIAIIVSIFLYARRDKQDSTKTGDKSVDFTSQDYTEQANDTIVPPGTAQTSTGSNNAKSSSVSSGYSIQIPKINVNAPLSLNVDGNNKELYMKTLETGVAHMQKTALPGEAGNSVIFGHSSYYASKPGSFKEVFAPLDKLVVGDKITIFSSGNAFSYIVTEKKIVPPSDISVVQQDKTKKTMTLITCWPPKTTTNRYIVVANYSN